MDLYYVLEILYILHHMFSTIDTKFYNNGILIDPPKKITKNNYRCDTNFNLDSLINMYNKETKFGVVLISGKEYYIYHLIKSGNHIDYKILYKHSVYLTSQTRAGGQSAQRYGRIRDGQRKSYIKDISQKMVDIFSTNNICNVNSIILAGPAELKLDVFNNNIVNKIFKNKIIKILDTDTINETTILYVYKKCIDVLLDNHHKESFTLLNKIENMIEIADDKLVFGKDIQYYMKNYMLDKLLIGENNDSILDFTCKVYRIDDKLIKDYGGMIGIKYY